MRWGHALIAISLAAGCVHDQLVLCDDGRACPVGSICDTVHTSCAYPEQYSACNGVAEGADCNARSITGGCFDGVCLPRGCGNHVIETAEQCDDGNQRSDDGCRADCRSNERCGNDVLDGGEECDRGDLVSHDGCDSQCRVESATWTFVPHAPSYLSLQTVAMDESRGRLVAVAGRFTFEWTSSGWTGVIGAPDGGTGLLFYDSARARVETITNDLVLHEWDGAAWTVRTTSGAPAPPPMTTVTFAAYDRARQRVVVFYTSTFGGGMWTIDTAGTWTQQVAPSGLGPRVYSGVDRWAFDPNTNELIIHQGNNTEWIFNGSGWTSSAADAAWMRPGAMIFDPGRGHLLLIIEGPTNTPAQVWERINSAWVRAASLDPGQLLVYPQGGFDPIRNVVVVVDLKATLVEHSTSGWTQPTLRAPVVRYAEIAADGAGTLLLVGGHNYLVADQAWLWRDDVWTRIQCPLPASISEGSALTYDPDRRAFVVYSGGQTWTYDGNGWLQLAAPAIMSTFEQATPAAMAFDPVKRQVVLAVGMPGLENTPTHALWHLTANNTAWEKVSETGELPPWNVSSLVWDAHAGVMTATAGSDAYDLDSSGHWSIAGSPGGYGVADVRAGTLLLIPTGRLRVWQRVNGVLEPIEELPVTLPPNDGVELNSIVQEPASGRVVAYVAANDGTYSLVRSLTSATPFESCSTGDDLDGDGAAGCTDLDCWWSCAPRCPLYTTCM